MSYKEVACGVMYNSENKILMGLRPEGSPYAGIWEFPGGQLEKNETIEECLHREWMEELNLNIQIKKEIYNAFYGKYLCRFFVGKILNEDKMEIKVHDNIKFCNCEDILNLKIFDGDKEVLSYL